MASGRLLTADCECEQLREVSHIDFVHERRYMDVGGWGGELAPVTFLGEKSRKISIV